MSDIICLYAYVQTPDHPPLVSLSSRLQGLECGIFPLPGGEACDVICKGEFRVGGVWGGGEGRGKVLREGDMSHLQTLINC